MKLIRHATVQQSVISLQKITKMIGDRSVSSYKALAQKFCPIQASLEKQKAYVNQ